MRNGDIFSYSKPATHYSKLQDLENENTTITIRESRGLAGIDGREAVENVDEFIHERLAFNAKQ